MPSINGVTGVPHAAEPALTGLASWLCAGDLGLIMNKTIKLEWHRLNNSRTRCLRITQKEEKQVGALAWAGHGLCMARWAGSKPGITARSAADCALDISRAGCYQLSWQLKLCRGNDVSSQLAGSKALAPAQAVETQSLVRPRARRCARSYRCATRRWRRARMAPSSPTAPLKEAAERLQGLAGQYDNMQKQLVEQASRPRSSTCLGAAIGWAPTYICFLGSSRPLAAILWPSSGHLADC